MKMLQSKGTLSLHESIRETDIRSFRECLKTALQKRYAKIIHEDDVGLKFTGGISVDLAFSLSVFKWIDEGSIELEKQENGVCVIHFLYQLMPTAYFLLMLPVICIVMSLFGPTDNAAVLIPFSPVPVFVLVLILHAVKERFTEMLREAENFYVQNQVQRPRIRKNIKPKRKIAERRKK